jgi:hypothetical protein
MGHQKWSAKSYSTYSTSANLLSRDALYHKRDKNDNNKAGQKINIEEIKFRESRDSDEHPNSTPIIVGLDVTGSMGVIPEKLTKGGLGTFVNNILQNRPVPDPHILFMGIGDAVAGDKAPLQVTQFETDNVICDQLTDIWLEGGGGANTYESYDLAWAFGAYKTQTDAWEKRKQKGFLFTVGDELFPMSTNVDYFTNMFSNNITDDPTPTSLLEAASEKWNIYHIIIAQGHFTDYRGQLQKVKDSWKQHLNRRALVLYNYDYLPQLLVSAIALESGQELDDVLNLWSDDVQTELKRTFNDQ